MLEEYVKDNYHARFHNICYHRCRESRFNILLEMNHQWQTNEGQKSHPAASRCDKNDVYPCLPHFYYIKVGLKRV